MQSEALTVVIWIATFAVHARLWLLSMTPLGGPVVPEV